MTENRKTPKLRFKGFTDAWEQRKLSEVLSSYTDPVEIPRTGYERLGIRSHAKGTFHNFVPAGHELQTAQMHRVAADKFIVNITFGWEHAVAVTDENDAGKLVSHRFPQFSLSEELDPKFLKFIILDEDFRHHLWLASPGGAGRNRVLNINEMLQYEIMIPNVPEQRKIARMLIDLDNLITLHQRKLDKLKNIKKSMLDNMFV
jgi:putative type I restriction enzyme specificity protein